MSETNKNSMLIAVTSVMLQSILVFQCLEDEVKTIIFCLFEFFECFVHNAVI